MWILIIKVNKKEVECIRAKCPNVFVTRTMKQKSKRHTYYVPEIKSVLKILRVLRNGGVKSGK